MIANKPELNGIVHDPILAKDILINECTLEGIIAFPGMKEAYEEEYPKYSPDREIVKRLTDLLKNLSITIILGTWCKDSQIEVARFLKVMNVLNVPDTAMKFIAVDKSKSAKPDLIDHLMITNVPTFIVEHLDQEIGRIVEHPVVDIESDFLKIVD